MIVKAQQGIVNVQLKNGWTKGVQEKGAYVFKGLPYAQSPVGKWRFLAPQQLANWQDTLDATKFGPVSPQGSHRSEEGNYLNLNVFTSSLNSSQLKPVLVWIHGGSMTAGTGKDYNGHVFSDEDSIVTVTINYRLGALGFLDLRDWGEKYKSSGNNGVLDCIAALEWVHTNIKSFGGDPHRVTIMGESAGAKLVAAIMATSQSNGLFKQAILESGGVQCIRDARTTKIIRQRLLDSLGISNTKELLKLSSEKIIAAQEKVLGGAQGTNYFGPVEDGILYKEDAYNYLDQNASSQWRVLIGSNKSEAKLFMGFDKRLYHPDETAYKGWFGNNGPIVSQAISKALRPSIDSEPVLVEYFTQYMYAMHTSRLANVLQRKGIPTYFYHFNYGKPPYGAIHAGELRFVWSNPEMFSSEGDKYIGTSVHKTWVDFIYGRELKEWPLYEGNGNKIKVFDVPSSAIKDLKLYQDNLFPSAVYLLK